MHTSRAWVGPAARLSLWVAALTSVIVVALWSTGHATAIQYGEPDNGAHPYVGGLVYEINGFQVVGCSGVLINPKTFVTASHCAPDETFKLVGITFLDAFSPGSPMTRVSNKDFVTNPDYDHSAYTDVAVVLLNKDPGVGHAVLAALNTLEPSDELTAVGYGSTGLNRGSGGKPRFVYPAVRMRSENQVVNLDNAWLAGLLVETTAAPGTGGGTCYGDSGGPFFLAGTSTVVAITITGTNYNCGGTDISLRLDTRPVQDFLNQFE